MDGGDVAGLLASDLIQSLKIALTVTPSPGSS